jgi:hypothetical protein
VVEVLRETADADAIVVSDPVGGGEERGAHNCGDCDERLLNAIEDFDLRQDPTVFDQVGCECEAVWETVLAEETAYATALD